MKNVKFGVFSLGLALAVAAAVTSLAAQGRVERAPRRDVMILDGSGLGTRVSDLDVKAATSGVRVDEVYEDSAAQKAGIKPGDIVVDYDGERVRSARQFTRLVQETPDGRSVAIGLMRDGTKQTVNATPEAGRTAWNIGGDVERALREAERGLREFRYDGQEPYFNFRFENRDRDNREPRRFEDRVPNDVMPFLGRSRGRLGVSVQSLTDDLEEYFGAANGGALVSSVTRDSAAAKAGIKAGDVVVSINGKAVGDAQDLIDELENIEGEATIVVLRDKKEMTLKASLSLR